MQNIILIGIMLVLPRISLQLTNAGNVTSKKTIAELKKAGYLSHPVYFEHTKLRSIQLQCECNKCRLDDCYDCRDNSKDIVTLVCQDCGDEFFAPAEEMWNKK